MFRRLSRSLIALAVAFSIGLHWNLLQLVAWGGMLVNYAQQGSVREAVAKTFDGEHPCCMCKAIEKGKREEQKAPQQKQDGAKLELFCTANGPVVFPPPAILTPPAANEQSALRTTAPPVPPPRVA